MPLNTSCLFTQAAILVTEKQDDLSDKTKNAINHRQVVLVVLDNDWWSQ